MAWSEAAHAAFPRGFRAAAACLLLCLHRLATAHAPARPRRSRRARRRSWRAASCAGSPRTLDAPDAASAYGYFLPAALVRASSAERVASAPAQPACAANQSLTPGYVKLYIYSRLSDLRFLLGVCVPKASTCFGDSSVQ